MFDLLRRNRDFRALVSALVISYMGDWFATVALLGILQDLTHSDLAASSVFVAATLPQFLAAPLAGPSADRFDRRKLMALVASIQTVLAFGFLLIGPGRAWVAFAAQGSISFLAAFFGPAAQAAVPNLVDPEDLPTATALMAGTWGSMLAVGSALGGVFTVLFGRKAAFVADAATFALAGALVASIRRPTHEAREKSRERMRPLADTAEALRYARHNPPVLALLMVKMGFGLSGGMVGVLPALSTRVFHFGDGGTAALLSARGVGAFAGPAIARRYTNTGGVGRVIVACGGCALVYGTTYVGVSAAPLFVLVAALVLIAHLGGGAQWSMSTYGLQVATPDALRGRIFAADFALVTLSLAVSFFAAGAASQRYGPRPVILVLALVNLAWGAAYLALTRRLWHPQPQAVGNL